MWVGPLQKTVRSHSPRGSEADGALASKAIEYRGAEGVVIRSTAAATIASARTSHSVEPKTVTRTASSFRGKTVDSGRGSPRVPKFDAMNAMTESFVPVAPPRLTDAVAVQSPRAMKAKAKK